MDILGTKYKKLNIGKVIHNHCGHLSSPQQTKLLGLLVEYEELFDGTLGNFHMSQAKFRLKEGVPPYHGQAYPVPRM